MEQAWKLSLLEFDVSLAYLVTSDSMDDQARVWGFKDVYI